MLHDSPCATPVKLALLSHVTFDFTMGCHVVRPTCIVSSCIVGIGLIFEEDRNYCFQDAWGLGVSMTICISTLITYVSHQSGKVAYLSLGTHVLCLLRQSIREAQKHQRDGSLNKFVDRGRN
ncbi:hypothetical protein F4774DRAFT_315584 [Daldinia eschscholtzii]|nr:hypothetical protein F4774DRAFT_315584 [Daldinia eschscholtzii]